MKKFGLRLLALILVLCMVVPCMPLGALATDLTRPENISDEEWDLLRQKMLEQKAAEQAAAEEAAKKAAAEAAAAQPVQPLAEPVRNDPPPAETLPETDALSESKEGNLVVTDDAVIPTDAPPAIPTDAPPAVKEQTVSVELPAEADKIVEETVPVGTGTDTKEVITNESQETIKIEGKDTEVTVKESYDLTAEIQKVETDSTDSKKVTDITYDISLDTSTSVEDASGKDIIKSEVTEDIDVVMNQAAEEAKLPEPQYKVDMTANGMASEEITRVEHKYTTPKGDGSADEEEHVEYYYNAKNGTEDTTKKYFTVSVVDKVKESANNVKETVKETVVSLWTSFLGVFHITTDAFENVDTKDTYASLEEAQPDPEKGAPIRSVEMLRDYKTDSTANLDESGTKLDVDLNGHEYTNTSDNAAIAVNGNGNGVTIQNGDVVSNGDGIVVSGEYNKLSLWDLFVRSNADKDNKGQDAGVKITGSDNTVNVEDSYIDGTRSNYGIQDASSNYNTVNIDDSFVGGKTGVGLQNTDAEIEDSYLLGTSGAAVAVSGNSGANDVIITSGWFESGKDVANITAKNKGDIASITVKGGRFTDPAGLYSYIPYGYATISHNDGSYFLYEVVGTDYTPTREGYEFLGYRDANGKAISLKDAYLKGVIAYAQWKKIPETTTTTTKTAPLFTIKTDAKGGISKVIYKGDTAFITVKNAKGEFLPISQVTIPSIKRLQKQKIDTVEIQVDEDVKLVLDVEKAKENGFTDIVEVMLEKDMLLITSGKNTCIELDIAELKEADKPVEIQLVEGKLTILLGKNSSMNVDLTKALKTGERIVVKLEKGVLKLYDKYHKPIQE